ncbi:VirB4 family type IV secretion/conjugal transfer ATPase [Helicobacter pylori]|nr:VirB4 family type IV secretion/conjugal transfer ATPase [Helicobacter pylori]
MLEKVFNFLCSLVPKSYSMKEETNIVGIYNEHYLLSEKSNLVGALKLEGISYLSLDDKEIAQKFNERILALNEIVDGVHFKIVARRRKIFMHHEYTQEEISNPFALEVINLWEQGVEDVYQNFYYLIFETKNDSIKGYLERFKKKITTNELENIQENDKQDEVKYQENYFIGFDNFNLADKSKILDSIINNVKNMLSGLFVEKLDANSLLNFYAEYINGVPSEYTFSRGRLHDGMINSDVHFKKDFFTHIHNGKEIFKRFISIKTYDIDKIVSTALSSVLHLSLEFDVILNIDNIPKAKAEKRIETKRKRANKSVRAEIDELNDMVKTDRVLMQEISLNILVHAKTKTDLDSACIEITNLLKQKGIVSTQESIGMLPMFFSFFPNRNRLNFRKRLLSSQNIASLIILEKQNCGFSRNSWGNRHLTIFRNQDKSPYLFNFHAYEAKRKNDMVLGHTIIFGGTGAGKTTLIEFLITNCFKYEDLSILALDRNNGMRVMTEFLDGQYNDSNDFYINPFSLKDTSANCTFLVSWLAFMLNIDEDTKDEKEKKTLSALSKTIRVCYNNITKQGGAIFKLRDFKDTLERDYLDSKDILEKESSKDLYKHSTDCLDFAKKLSVIDMDALSSSKKDFNLAVLYLFYKVMNRAKLENKPFYIFIDEAKSVIENPIMLAKIKDTLAQARKLNGVLTLAFQDINQLDGVEGAKSIIENAAQVILYPTNNFEKLESYGILLSPIEKSFLNKTPLNARQVLVKNLITQSSVFLEINLEKLNSTSKKFLRAYNSSASSVFELETLKKDNPKDYKEIYLTKE